MDDDVESDNETLKNIFDEGIDNFTRNKFKRNLKYLKKR